MVAAGEESKLPRIVVAHFGEPHRGGAQRFLPFDLAEFTGAAVPYPEQGPAQAGRRVMLHDSGRTLAANDALVHRMAAVAFDIGDGAILQIDLYPATARAHVASGGRGRVPGLGRGIDKRFGHFRIR